MPLGDRWNGTFDDDEPPAETTEEIAHLVYRKLEGPTAVPDNARARLRDQTLGQLENPAPGKGDKTER